MQVHNSVPSSLKRHIVPNLPHIQKSNFVSDELVSYLQYVIWGAVCLKTKKNVYIYKYTTQYVNVAGDIYIPQGIYISHKGYIISHKGYIYPTRDILYPSGDIYIQPGIYIYLLQGICKSLHTVSGGYRSRANACAIS